MTAKLEIRGRLVLNETVVPGRLLVEDGRVESVDLDSTAGAGSDDLPYIAPGFVDVHVHGWGGHDAMGPTASLDGMARALLRHGVTSFLPTGYTSPWPALRSFAERVRAWIPHAPSDGADPIGFNIEGPFLAPTRRGAHNQQFLRTPADVPWSEVEPLVDGLRLVTIAPELPGALELIKRLREAGVRVSLGHSAADLAGAIAGYDAGGTSTTHLFNAMTGIEHRAPGVAVAALARDDAFVELIADGLHVHPAVWPIIWRTKPSERLMLVSDALALAGMGDGKLSIGGLQVEVHDGRCTVMGTDTLAGSVIALDTSVRNLVAEGTSLAAAVAAASSNPVAMLGLTDRGRIEAGLRADLVELDGDLQVQRVMRAGEWHGA